MCAVTHDRALAAERQILGGQCPDQLALAEGVTIKIAIPKNHNRLICRRCPASHEPSSTVTNASPNRTHSAAIAGIFVPCERKRRMF